MSKIKLPLRDIEFALFELFHFEEHYADYCPSLDRSLTKALLNESARFCEDILAPLSASGDTEGCRLVDGEVITPAGFKTAYQQYCDAGWPSLARSAEFGGQGLPQSLGIVMNELSATANYAWTMYPGLSQGAMHTIESHGSDFQKQTYLPALISGEWTGTMCLTEAHCGTDLGLLKTKATPVGDGSFSLTGTKIFISSGDHDLAQNIVHIVLARLPDAPAGTKGISLFIVPKFTVNADGSLGARNGVSCGSLEHKMGIHGNATCVLNFDGAVGTLLGEANKGLHLMFTFMNLARLGAALQGIAHAESGFQAALNYSRERLQGRSLSGAKNPTGVADPIISHPDVRRMLMTQKALSEGMRMMAYFAAKRVDIAQHAATPEKRQMAQDMLSVVTPIAKGFITELGFESASLALQCFGGHGYIKEWGVEQNLRDCRIASLYEGTTGVQALDLLGRKILLSDGKLMDGFTKCIQHFCQDPTNAPELSPYADSLTRLHTEWLGVTQHIGALAQQNPDEVGAASVDYLMYCGYIFMGYLWARAAKTALAALATSSDEQDFYRAKLATARFYFERILPRTLTLVATIKSGANNLMELPAEQFAF
ncbi:acyl-CoA dehydrogenase [Cellvibrio zantedeschiae]|uniref:Acyl-CoA dehydrogenase n=1 Tax=Cellvibrio zantedeschiae TaxID=1237077 RepID=A0ABQ3AUR6_9GAMM|nr:acyl-CoA dehydrogenase C-terminal domain-containing protein [Cellvibrio zantedeschiae]GGY64748.1 acyl-CoA dehydrogenase [Cellvibrio zantedeschiae]